MRMHYLFENTAAVHHLIIAADKKVRLDSLDSGTQLFLKMHAAQAFNLVNASIKLLLFSSKERRLFRISNGTPVTLSTFDPDHAHLIMNPCCLFQTADTFIPLLKQAQAKARYDTLTWIGSKTSREVYAFAFLPSKMVPRVFWQALDFLAICLEDSDKLNLPPESLDSFCDTAEPNLFNSPAMASSRAISWPEPPPFNDSRIFVNTAFREMVNLHHQVPSKGDKPGNIIRILKALRDTSKVPWIFNSLLNEIEYKTGQVVLTSYPPELHLSTTGACNIECQFCSYQHKYARKESVTQEQITSLKSLDKVQRLRLQSGNGEPTMNRNLPEILEYLVQCYPHLEISFYTNGTLLGKPKLLDAIVGKVQWINVSINVNEPGLWKKVCGADLFEVVCSNLKKLRQLKVIKETFFPIIKGSIVLTRESVRFLPEMPALCRELGIDRLVAFPFFSLGYADVNKYNEKMCFDCNRDNYELIYAETVEKAQEHAVSIELPLPGNRKKVRYGLEQRRFYDFAGIEFDPRRLAQLVDLSVLNLTPQESCEYLWSIMAIGSTSKILKSTTTHYMYPCVGPLAQLDLSSFTPFPLPQKTPLLNLWNNRVFTLLRTAQLQKGVVPICDFCRENDTRNPDNFLLIEKNIRMFEEQISTHYES